MTQPIVEIRNLSRIFRRDSVEVVALKDINLDIPEGDFLALMGPSGSGKTTLLNIIAGLDKPTSGIVRVGGIEVQRMSEDELAEWRNHHVGFVFQTFNLIPVLTAFENVELPLLLTGLSSQERREHVLTALKLVGLADRVDHYPRQLSGGQEQRVAIARAIVTDPTIILADEPTGNLDARSAEEILTLLQQLNEQLHKTIVLVTHDPRAAHYAKHERHLEKGILLPPGVTYTVEERA
ncbi:MAG: ABC transporter ATP-binding protein [Acidobacteria bacterium]|nr:MAG: ABC transporter ATP-binding protein [Acidobacteriota bacterium]